MNDFTFTGQGFSDYLYEMEEAIWTDLERSFCLRGDSVTPVSGGWMNRK